MKLIKLLAVLFVFLSSVPLFAEGQLPDFWHTPEEIESVIFGLQQMHPDIVKVDSIGVVEIPYDRTLNPDLANFPEYYPIWAVKISDNVNVDEDEPAVMYTCLHAEEVIGTEISITAMQQILSRRNSEPYASWIANMEMWFIPTANPAGLKVVHELDNSYRKNMADTNNDGIFEYVQGYGFDRDGVDLNRNFAYNWVHGDTLYSPNGQERYDYYRGSNPMSEPELQAIKRLCDEQHMISGVVWHTSRTGNFSEKLFYPYEFYANESRRCVDYDLTSEFGEAVAALIKTEDNSSTYMPAGSTGYRGVSTPWFYNEYGSIHFTIEASNNQPPTRDAVDNIIRKCFKGLKYINDRVIGNTDTCPMLTGNITDAATGQPIVAEVYIENHEEESFKPRVSDELYGRYWRPIEAGQHTVTFSKQGYQPQTINVVVGPAAWTIRNIELQPLEKVTYNGTVTLDGNPVDAEINVYDVDMLTVNVVNGAFEFETYATEQLIKVSAEGAYPYMGIIEPTNGHYNLTVNLNSRTTIFEDTFENGLTNWQTNGPWVAVNLDGNTFAADSFDGEDDVFYAQNADVNLTLNQTINLSSAANPMLVFDQHLYTESEFDFVSVEYSLNGSSWTAIWQDTGKADLWHEVTVPLNDLPDGDIQFRFRLKDDSPDQRLVDPGWRIDNIKIIDGSASVNIVDAEDDVNELVPVSYLAQNSPNPFNPSTTIRFELPKNHKRAKLEFYNVKGQKVNTVKVNNKKQVAWEPKGLASGVYFYRLVVDGKTVNTKKALLLK